MTWRRFTVGVLLTLALATCAQAGWFTRRPKETPTQRVSELVGTLQSGPSESARESAAEELRQFDPQQYPEVVPALLGALQRDPKPSVRAEAAISLGKLRPVSAQVGAALEQALANDSATRVRVQVRTVLWEYRLAGYRSGKGDAPATATAPTSNGEPPLPPPAADPRPTSAPPARPLPAPVLTGPRLSPTPIAPSPTLVSEPSPIATPPARPAVTAKPGPVFPTRPMVEAASPAPVVPRAPLIAQPMPVGPPTPPAPVAKPPLVPTETPILEAPPSAPELGPPLLPPQ